MFAKVLKYEAKETGWLTLTLVVAGAVIIFCSGLAFMVPNGPLAAVRGLSLTTGVLIALVLPFGLFVSATVRYWKTMYGQRGYFTHALPVGGGTILAAKTLWLTLVTTISAVLLLGGVIWMATTQTQINLLMAAKSHWTFQDGFEAVAGSIRAAGEIVPGLVKWMLLGIVVVAILEIVSGMLFASALSNRWPFSAQSPGLGFALAAVVTYVLTQILKAIFLFSVPGSISVTSEDGESKLEFIKDFFWQTVVDNAGTEEIGFSGFVPLGTLLIPLLVIAMYVFAHLSLTRRLNLR